MTAINSNRAIRGPVTAVPVVSGKGVRLVADTENNRWVVEADETELWSSLPGSTTGNLSEAITNFERVRVYWHYHENGASLQSPCIMEIPVDPSYTRYFLNVSFGGTNCYLLSLRMDFSNGFASFTVQSGSGVVVGAWGGGGTVASIPSGTIANCIKGVYKIVGINRVSGGN